MQSIRVNDENVDVLIAGGGVAGAAAAAALSQLGLNILIIEPSPDKGRRLAGELIHPPGVEGLYELGLLSEDLSLGSKVNGFAVYPYTEVEATGPMVLPYGEVKGLKHTGIAIEHNVLKDQLLQKVQSFAGVCVWLGARVTRMEGGSGLPYTAVVQREEKETRVHARLIIAADGPLSQLRKMVGITHETQRYSGMVGVELEDTHLPHAGYGNIFLNPAGVSYAYTIGKGRARVMFEVLRGADSKQSIRAHLERFPTAFRQDIERVLAESKPLAAANYCIIPSTSVKNNIALLGDARGCCHPLTASGITAAVKDAIMLRDALRQSKLDFPAALHQYALRGDRLQLTRRTLAEELREAFLAQTPEATLLSQCIFSYWRTSSKGRMHSMALLSTLDSSIFSLAIQYALVVLHAFRLLPKWMRQNALGAWHKGVLKLLYKSLAFQQTAVAQWVKGNGPLAKRAA